MAKPSQNENVRCIERGVFDADPFAQPTPPPGARAVEIHDAAGRVIAFAWVIADHATDHFFNAAWDWLDAHDRHPSAPLLRLVRP
jgi:hypothetical protein